MEFEDSEKPLIVRRVKKKHRGHHGGAWKVAFADFAVAMMAFFLVLWLMEAASIQEKAAISGYFSDPTAFTEGGSPYVIDLGGGMKDDLASDSAKDKEAFEKATQQGIALDEETVQDLAKQIEDKKFRQLRRMLQARIEENPVLKKYKDQIIMEITDDGLQIQIVDKQSRPMFDSASAEIKSHTTTILKELAQTIDSVPNKVSVSGHTDAAAFLERKDYSNWDLSAERANAARRALNKGGLSNGKIAQVVGLASSALFDKDNPMNPINRRISILVLNDKSAARIKRQQSGGHSKEDSTAVDDIPEKATPSASETEETISVPVEEEAFATPEADNQESTGEEEVFESFDQVRDAMNKRQQEFSREEDGFSREDSNNENTESGDAQQDSSQHWFE